MTGIMDGPAPDYRELSREDLLAARDTLWQIVGNIEHTGKGDKFRLTSLSLGYTIRFLERTAEGTI